MVQVKCNQLQEVKEENHSSFKILAHEQNE